MSFTIVSSSQPWGIGKDFKEIHLRLHVCYFYTCIMHLTGNWIPIRFSISLFFHHRLLERMLASYYRVALKQLVAHLLMYSVTVLWSVNNFYKTVKTPSKSWCKTRPRRLVFIRKSFLHMVWFCQQQLSVITRPICLGNRVELLLTATTP